MEPLSKERCREVVQKAYETWAADDKLDEPWSHPIADALYAEFTTAIAALRQRNEELEKIVAAACALAVQYGRTTEPQADQKLADALDALYETIPDEMYDAARTRTPKETT